MTDTAQDGSFTFTIGSDKLSKGLRPSKRMPRDSGFLVECKGAVGLDGTLQTIESITRMATSAINTAFPYPQIFVFVNCIIVCNETAIYEWVAGSLVSKITGLTAGSTWSAVDFYDYVYLSNGRVAVVRVGGTYTVSTLPHATAICNFNGQVLIGAPDVNADIATLVLPTGNPGVTITVLGSVIVGIVKRGPLNVRAIIEGNIT